MKSQQKFNAKVTPARDPPAATSVGASSLATVHVQCLTSDHLRLLANPNRCTLVHIPVLHTAADMGNDTLKPGEVGLIFLGMLHSLDRRLAAGIQIIRLIYSESAE